MWLNVFPGVSIGLRLANESNSLPLLISFGPVPDVIVCACESSFTQVTMSPTLICTGLGEKALVVLSAEPCVMLTFSFAAALAGANKESRELLSLSQLILTLYSSS